MAKNYRDRKTGVVLGYNPEFARYPTVEEFDDEEGKERSDSSQKPRRPRVKRDEPRTVIDDDLG